MEFNPNRREFLKAVVRDAGIIAAAGLVGKEIIDHQEWRSGEAVIVKINDDTTWNPAIGMAMPDDTVTVLLNGKEERIPSAGLSANAKPGDKIHVKYELGSNGPTNIQIEQ